MRTSPLLSLIVPVYNCEDYLRPCLDSLRNQVYSNYEVILINDGSTDGSESICKEYERADERFHLIAQDNRGSSAARNAGIRRAKGELIGFVDSDDSVSPYMYEKLYAKMKDDQADIALCDIINEKGKEHPDWTDEVFVGREAVFSEFIRGHIINRVYNKIYRTEMIRGIEFPVGRNMMEDASWTPRVLERTTRVTRLAEALYYYRDNQEGITRSKPSSVKNCSRFANLLDREYVCLQNVHQEKDRYLIASELIGYICQMMESYDDLSLFDVDKQLKAIVTDNYHTIVSAVNNREEAMMLEAIRAGDIHSAKTVYRKAVWLHGHSVKSRLRLIKRWVEHALLYSE